MNLLPQALLPPAKILITGCSSGIGYDCAHRLHDMGYVVVAACRKKADVNRLISEGLHAVVLDLASSKSVASGLEEALKITGGKIDALFNNGAFGVPGAVEDLSRKAMLFQFQTNVFGTQELTNQVIPLMREQGHGRIVYNSSVLGFVSMQYRGAYNASKYALEGFADTLRLELKNDNIKVVLIEPGPIETDFRKNAVEQFKHWIDSEESHYKQDYDAMMGGLEKEGPAVPFTLGSDAVTDAFLRAIKSGNPKVRYRVTKPTKVFAYLKRILPASWLDKLLVRVGER